MKIIALFGSPRAEGNSARLAQAFLEACAQRGAEVSTYHLNKMSYQGCQACMGCKTKSEACILNDDMTPVYEAIRSADVLVFASPVYFGEISGQLKLALDRFYAYLTPDFASRLPAGKQWVLFLTQGQPDEKLFAEIFSRYEFFMKWLGFGPNHVLRGCGLGGPEDVKQQPQLLQQAAALAEQVMGQ
ncbi:MAG: flavodoxin family protein [Desulfobacca sp.]|uniref:flavodoxin family protein n=1 Tax=Desulfobacca sp. TaxID=2067990 RepID=UPI00404B203C